MYSICLHKGINTKKTEEHIRQNPNITDVSRYAKIGKLIVLIPKEKSQKDFNKRKANIENIFELTNYPSNVLYTDNFVWEYCIPNEYKRKIYDYLSIKAQFVDPYVAEYLSNSVSIRRRDKLESKDITNTWLNNEESSILLLLGSGGIGKTTLAQSIADAFQKLHPETSQVMFINSNKIISNLQKIGSTRVLDLYSFYEASLLYPTIFLSS